MHRKQLYFDIPICLFLARGVGTIKTFTLKLIIQGLLWLYNKNISFNWTKTKALLMASISKSTFNIDGLIIHLTLNILVQQSLFSSPNLSRLIDYAYMLIWTITTCCDRWNITYQC
jgi:hypothetical protein